MRLPNYIVCPKCKGCLESADDELVCSVCLTHYKVEDGIPILVPPGIEAFKQIERDYHNAGASQYAQKHYLDSVRVQTCHDDFLTQLKRLPPNAIVLELGCGAGYDGSILLEQGLFVIESDISKESVHETRRNQSRNGHLNATYLVCDAENLPCMDACLDAILIVASLHHLPNPLLFMKLASQCLKPNGLLVVGFEPNRMQYLTLYVALRQFRRVTPAFQRLRGKAARASIRSIGDDQTMGFTERDWVGLGTFAGLKLCYARPIWYLSGWLHFALEVISRIILRDRGHIDAPKRFETFLLHVDSVLARLPLLRSMNWHWNVVYG